MGRSFFHACVSTIALLIVMGTVVSDVPGQPVGSVSCSTPNRGYFASPCAIGSPNVNVVFVTWKDVVTLANGDSTLPTYADAMVIDFDSFIERTSINQHTPTFNVIKRPSPQQNYAWVYPYSGRNLGEMIAWLDTVLPSGWSTETDHVLLFFSVLPEGVNPNNNGVICTTTGLPPRATRCVIPWGYITYQPAPLYLTHPRHFVQYILTHEYGHGLGLDHLPSGYGGPLGEDACGAEYYKCYCAMENDGAYLECSNLPGINGLIPYHSNWMAFLNWWNPQIVTSTTNNIVLHDARTTGEMIKIPLCTDETNFEYFLLANYQQTGEDSILNGRGLLVWHIRQRSNFLCTEDETAEVWDLETPLGKWQRIPSTSYCRAFPTIPDAAAGTDTLDCVSEMYASSFWAGFNVGLAGQTFGPNSNPSTNGYDVGIFGTRFRNSPQTRSTGVTTSGIKSEPDPLRPGKYQVKLNVTISGQQPCFN